MNRFLILIAVLLTLAPRLLAGDGARSGVVVEKVRGSSLSIAEKWLDRQTGVVCYIIGQTQSTSVGTSISCVPLKRGS